MDGCLPFKYVSSHIPPPQLFFFSSLLETCYEHVLKLASSPCMQTFCMTYHKPPLNVPGVLVCLFFFFFGRGGLSLKLYISALFHAPSTRAQPPASQWTFAKRIFTPSRVGAWVFTQRSRWSSILFRQASKHTAWRLSNYPPAKKCVCHHCFVHSSFNLI